MIVYSMFPIDRRRIRTFQKFLWKDMPQAMMPVDESAGKPYYSQAVLKAFRLSSKSHWDLPIIVSGKTLHLLASHPTPPVFDGPEDRNGRRNHDEIRLFADYIDPQRSGYIYDDQGRMGGLAAAQYFVIAGDLNADPHDGDSTDRAVNQLIDHPLINSTTIPVSEGGPQQSRRQAGANRQHQGNPAHDTSDFDDNRVGNLRLDYLLPSRSLKVINGGVYWPRVDSKATDLVDASDHRLVWIDIQP